MALIALFRNEAQSAGLRVRAFKLDMITDMAIVTAN